MSFNSSPSQTITLRAQFPKHLPNLSQLELQDLPTGTILPFNQQKLAVFHISNNRLKGKFPETPVLQPFLESSYDHVLELGGKPWENCQAASVSEPPSPALAPFHPKAEKDKRLKIWSTALIAVPTVLFPFTMVLVFLCYYRKIKGKGARKDKHSGTNIILQIKVCNSQLGRIWNWTNPIHKVDKIKLEIPL